jgi:hypothetical protein
VRSGRFFLLSWEPGIHNHRPGVMDPGLAALHL